MNRFVLIAIATFIYSHEVLAEEAHQLPIVTRIQNLEKLGPYHIVFPEQYFGTYRSREGQFYPDGKLKNNSLEYRFELKQESMLMVMMTTYYRVEGQLDSSNKARVYLVLNNEKIKGPGKSQFSFAGYVVGLPNGPKGTGSKWQQLVIQGATRLGKGVHKLRPIVQDNIAIDLHSNHLTLLVFPVGKKRP